VEINKNHMFYISICFTLLTILAALYVWAKTKNDQPHNLFKWLIYLVILAGFLLLACQFSRGLMRMKNGGNHEEKMMMMHHGKGMMMGDMNCCEGMRRGDKCLEERSGTMKKECCEEEDDDAHEDMDSTMHHEMHH
jgi:hypothetical protein